MSASQNFAGASARTNVRHGNVRVPSVLTRKSSCSATTTQRPPFSIGLRLSQPPAR